MSDHVRSEDAVAPESRSGGASALKGLAFLLAVGVVAAGLAMFVLTQRSEEGPKVVLEVSPPITVNVTAIEVQETYQTDEKFTGLVDSRRRSQLGFTSGGRVRELAVDLGDVVAEGDRLASLDMRALSAQLAAANARLVEAEAGSVLATTTADRQVALAAKGHVSPQVADEARAQANTAAARIDAARAEVQAHRVQMALATIEAPFSGVITARLVDEGAIAAPGQAVFELVEHDQLEAKIGLSAEAAARLEPGQTYRLITDRGPVEAHLRTLTGVIDANSRTIAAVFDLPSSAPVQPGEVIRLSVRSVEPERGVWVPVSALTERERGLWSVYVARSEGSDWLAQPDTVEVIHAAGEEVYVRGGLRDGDRVILDGLHRLTPGQRVAPVEVRIAVSDRSDG